MGGGGTGAVPCAANTSPPPTLSLPNNRTGWQVPSTLGQQWAYDPTATYKDARTVVQELLPIVVSRARGAPHAVQLSLTPPPPPSTLRSLLSRLRRPREGTGF
jgi:hypothetical protein